LGGGIGVAETIYPEFDKNKHVVEGDFECDSCKEKAPVLIIRRGNVENHFCEECLALGLQATRTTWGLETTKGRTMKSKWKDLDNPHEQFLEAFVRHQGTDPKQLMEDVRIEDPTSQDYFFVEGKDSHDGFKIHKEMIPALVMALGEVYQRWLTSK
jgi:hypothetical protein